MQDEVASPPVIVARQPIFDIDYNVYAYELLFRNSSNQSQADLNAISGDIATTRVINHAFLELGIERVIGECTAFVNLTRTFILSDDPMPFAQDRVVLEVLEDIKVDDEMLQGVGQLVSQGYTIALDDFIFHESLRPLISLASIIKVDILALTDAELRQHAHELRKYNVKLLAEKVETQAQFDLCRQLGFDYFQGYFFCRPDIIEDKPLPANQFGLMQILQKLQDPNVEFGQIESLISQDVTLSFKLLRLLNSAAMGMTRRIDSIHRGLVILGLKAIKTWITLIVMSEIESIPQELLNNALVRAKMCEDLAASYDCSADTGFLVGLFSAIDVMMSRPMQEILAPMQLNNEIKLALINRGGQMGRLLDNVIHYEQGQWENVSQEKVSFEQLSDSYVTATEWTLLTRQVI